MIYKYRDLCKKYVATLKIINKMIINLLINKLASKQGKS